MIKVTSQWLEIGKALELEPPDEETPWMLVAKEALVVGEKILLVCTWAPPPPGKGFTPFQGPNQ